MELRVNVVLLGVLVVAWASLSASEPAAALDPEDPATRELAALEDAFAHDPNDAALGRALAEAYLDIDQPGLAIAAIRASSADLMDDPMLAHRLSQAYERSGHLLDALATAELAAARCGRSLGTADSSSVTPEPATRCGAREYAIIEMHRSALDHMVRWGVLSESDPRVQTAYDLATRRASIASAQ